MDTNQRTTLARIALLSSLALVALLGAANASARSLDAPRTATRGPGAVTNYQSRPRTTASDFGLADGIVVGGFLVFLAFGFGYSLSSTRKRASVAPWDPPSSVPTSSNGRPAPTSQASRPATSRS